jgi:signal transduction histidine kinase
MRRRVLVAIMTVSAVVVLLFAVPLGFAVERFLDDRATIDLEHRVDVIARTVDLTSSDEKPKESDLPRGQFSFALYTPEGVRTLGNGPDQLETALRRSTSRGTTTIESGGSLLAAAPVVFDEVVTGIVRGQRSLRTVDRDARRAIGVLILGALTVLGVGWLIARRLAATLGNATETVSTAAQRLGDGDFTIDVPATGVDEVDRVATSLNMTARRLDQLVAREQKFSADVSHQLRTPLTGLRAALEAELAYPRADPTVALREALVDVARLEQTVEDILALARAERLATEPFALRPLLLSVSAAWIDKFSQQGRTFEWSCPDDLRAAGTPALLRQALDALLDNALRHGAGSTELVATSADRHVVIAVSDAGPGLSNRGGSTDGTGLGLALVERLVAAQGGRFIGAHPGTNPTFQILLREHDGSLTL